MAGQKFHFLFIKNKLFYFNPSAEHKLLEIKGDFSIGEDNNLIYRVRESSAWRRQYNFAEKIKFEGKWRLNLNHDLILDLEDKQRFGPKGLVLNGKIIRSQSNCLIFQLKSKTATAKEKISFLKLKGFWQVDKYNRITFEVSKKKNPDVLTLKGTWALNKNQQIVYAYRKTGLKTKNKTVHFVEFSGFWQINEKGRLKYILSRDEKSVFDFRVQAESLNLYPKKGEMKYRLGAGVRKGKGRGSYREKVILLYGEWKFSRRGGLSFEMDYGQKRFRRICFSAQINLSSKEKILFTLLGRDKKPLGLNVTFKKEMFSKRDFTYLLRLKKEDKDREISAGLTLKF